MSETTPARGEPEIGITHLALMRLISQQPSVSQRELSRQLGCSVGKTHYLLRALANKGWVKVQNFRRSNNKVAYTYLLTPSGILQKINLTRSFLQHKENEFETLQREIDALRAELHSSEKNCLQTA